MVSRVQIFLVLIILVSFLFGYFVNHWISYAASVIDPTIDLNAGTFDGNRSNYDTGGRLRIQKLIFNRVYKTGSTVTRTVITKLSQKLKYTDEKSTIYDHARLNTTEQRRWCHTITNLHRPVVYDRHIYFIDCKKFGLRNYPHINLVRDPVSRAISLYSFIKHGFNINDQKEVPKRYNMTMEECVGRREYQCITRFQQISFFCGQDVYCQFPSSSEEEDKALAQAKKNVENSFLVVGIYEELTTFFRVLEKLLPQFFKSAPSTYKKMSKSLTAKFSTKKKERLSEASLHILKKEFKRDYEFYYFIKQRFVSQVTRLLKQNAGAISFSL